MTDPIFTLTVYGTPQPAGSKRALPFAGVRGGRPIIVDAATKSRPWKNTIAQHAGEAVRGRIMFREPVFADFVFVVRRPKDHFTSKGDLRPSAARLPAKKPDLLKLARAVEDALTGIVYADDSLIVRESLTKVYGEPERVEIIIGRALPPDVVS